MLRLNSTILMPLCVQFEKEGLGLLHEASSGEGECPPPWPKGGSGKEEYPS